MSNQGIDQGSGFIASAWVNHKPRGLFDDDQIGILIDNLEGDILGRGMGGGGIGNADGDLFTAFQPLPPGGDD